MGLSLARHLLVALATVLASLVILYILLSRRIKERNKYVIYISTSSAKRDILYTVYRFLYYLPITRKTVKRVKTRYDTIFVGDEKRSGRETAKVLLLILVLNCIVGIFIVIGNTDLYGVALAFLMMYIIENEIILNVVDKHEIRLLIQLERYIQDLRRFYFRYNMVETAIEEANAVAKREMRLHGDKLLSVLTSSEVEEETLLYNEQVRNRFLRILLAVCSTVIEHGDKPMPNDETVFLYNLKELGKEISIEKLKRQKKRHVYLGTTFLTVFPIFSLPFIKEWAIENIEQLYYWYNGLAGISSMLMLFVLTLGTYNFLGFLKNTVDIDDSEHVLLDWIAGLPFLSDAFEYRHQKNYGKTIQLQDMIKHSGSNLTTREFYAKQIVSAIVYLGVAFFVIFAAHSSVKDMQLNYTGGLDSISSSVPEDKVDIIKKLVLKYTDKYKDSKAIVVQADSIALEMQKECELQNTHVFTILANEVVRRVLVYQSQYLKAYEVLLALALCILGYLMPYFILIARETFVIEQMEDEVIQFQTIIIMLIYFDRMTPKIILEWLDNFASVFKVSLEKCITNFSAGETEALEQLKEDEPFDPFVRLVENIEQSDRVGLRKAFNEIAVDRNNYQEKRKQENEISLQDRGALAHFFAMAPIGATILVYLIIPFVFRGLSAMQGLSGDLG